MTVISAWWRLNIRFKDSVGDRVGVELLFNSVEFGVPKQLQADFQTVETRCGMEGHTQPRGQSETPDAVASRIPDSQRPDVVGKATPDRGGPRKSPDGVDPKTSGWASKRTRKTQRDGHNQWGQNMKFTFDLQHPLTCKPFNNPFKPYK